MLQQEPYPMPRQRLLTPDELKDHIDRILQMDVGDRYAVEEQESPEILWALKHTALGGRRFRTYKSPDSFRVTIFRDRDATQESLLKEQFAARRAQLKAQADAQRHFANMRNAATMAQFESDKAEYAEETSSHQEVRVEEPSRNPKHDGKKYYDHKGNLLDHKPTMREKLNYALLKTPFFKEAE